MTRIENGCQSASCWEGFDQDIVHKVVDNVALGLIIHRVNHFIEAIGFIPIQIFGLTTVTRIMEEQRIIGLGTAYEPLHSLKDILARGHHARVSRIVGKGDDVSSLISELGFKPSQYAWHWKGLRMLLTDKEILNIFYIIDTPSELSVLSEVIDSNAKSLLFAATLRVLEEWL